MSEICEECDGDKICKHEYHDLTGRTNIFDSDNECPACGQPAPQESAPRAAVPAKRTTTTRTATKGKNLV
jgi:hypothetical protein